jgi:hypothetical protein
VLVSAATGIVTNLITSNWSGALAVVLVVFGITIAVPPHASPGTGPVSRIGQRASREAGSRAHPSEARCVGLDHQAP